MNKELCEESYNELIEWLKNDFKKKGKFLQSTTKLLLSWFCLAMGKDWKKDLNWEEKEDKRQLSFLDKTPTKPRRDTSHYLTPRQLAQSTNLFSESFIQSVLKNNKNVEPFSLQEKRKWSVDAFEFLEYLKKNSTFKTTKRRAQLFLENPECVNKLKMSVAFKKQLNS